ncbi:MAG: GNAT family N-acetyltransferase, partial [Pirellulales bacterium]
ARLLTSGGITANSWATCGDFLLDPQADATAVLSLVAEALNQAPWPWLCLSPVAYESPRWRLLVEAARYHGLDAIVVPSGQVGQVRIEGDWDDYRTSWSANHRRYLRKAQRRADQTSGLALDVHTAVSPQEVERLMRVGCEIEDRSWKGTAGTSVLRAPGMFDWHLHQAKRLADDGQLQLSFLIHGELPIAFEYGYRGKATYFSHKVGYDPAYAHFSPGQLLRALLLEHFFAARDVVLVDYWGPLSDATAKFATHQYPVGKILIAPRRFLSRALLAGYAAVRPYWRNVRSWLVQGLKNERREAVGPTVTR